jgi:short-subunit dehydrogenase
MLEENMTEWAVVTGASRGIGAAVAKLLKDGGIKVLAVDRTFQSPPRPPIW